ncbi:MAG: hypothetical protein ACFCU2_05275 [Acidimicrobiia bacterium]
MKAVSVLAASLLGLIALFQIALAAGVPWGAASWGGRHPGRLPTGYRVGSAVAGLFFYPAVAVYILYSAGVLGDGTSIGGVAGLWVLAGIFGLSTVINLISPSKVERIWAPVALVLTVCCAVLAISL